MGRPVKYNQLPDVEYLRMLFVHDEESGELTWSKRKSESFNGSEDRPADWLCTNWNNRYAGRKAGSRRPHGYHMTMVDGVHYMTHRIIWKLKTGEDPVEIDHIDGDRTNNRMANLRSVTRGINMKNKSLYKSNKSGIPGVEFHTRDKVWVAKIGVDGGQVQLGSYPTKDEAIAARIAGQVMLDYHENHGRSNVLKEN